MACSSPQESLNKNDYQSAYNTSLRKLKKSKSIETNKKILVESLQKIFSEETHKIRNLKSSDNLENQVKAISLLNKLQKKIDKSSKFTEGKFEQSSDYIKAELVEIKQNLSAGYFEKGISFLSEFNNTNLKKSARSAYNSFSNAQKYGNKNSNLDSLLNESL